MKLLTKDTKLEIFFVFDISKGDFVLVTYGKSFTKGDFSDKFLKWKSLCFNGNEPILSTNLKHITQFLWIDYINKRIDIDESIIENLYTKYLFGTRVKYTDKKYKSFVKREDYVKHKITPFEKKEIDDLIDKAIKELKL